LQRDRIVVTGVHLPQVDNAPSAGGRPPLALGMVIAYAGKMLGTDPAFDLEPRFATSVAELERITAGPGRHVLLYSDYVWSYDANIAASRHVKSLRPDVINVHGGANIPIYTAACDAFFRQHPHVDFVVKGEGETALVDLLAAIASGNTGTAEIPSISMMVGGHLVQHAARERARDIDDFPSPYLTGVFDSLEPERWVSATVESNRGCPYGCTFCDWGAATLQKIRTFSLERVRAEVTWLAERRVPAIWVADANFGILRRDVEVARIIVDVKKTYGYPRRLTTNYAKNTHQHLIEIIELFMENGLISTGIISIQTRDSQTLDIVRRKNIKTQEYDKLRAEFQRRGLPLAVQLMIGLPGATLDAMKGDLSFYFDSPIEVQLFRTVFLPNSPMAEPAYTAMHRIEVSENGLITSTATMSEADFDVATLIGRAFNGVHHFGLLRYLLVWLRWQHGIDPLTILHAMAVDDAVSRGQFPLLRAVLEPEGYVYDLSCSHAALLEEGRTRDTWAAIGDELLAWASPPFGVARDASWDAVAAAQAAVMPVRGRTYPYAIDLAHDVARWYADGREADGEKRALASYGPGRLVVEDPLGLSAKPYVHQRATRLQWELASALAHARSGDLGAPSQNQGLSITHAGVSLPWAIVSVET
jgi:hypothetical protein